MTYKVDNKNTHNIKHVIDYSLRYGHFNFINERVSFNVVKSSKLIDLIKNCVVSLELLVNLFDKMFIKLNNKVIEDIFTKNNISYAISKIYLLLHIKLLSNLYNYIIESKNKKNYLNKSSKNIKTSALNDLENKLFKIKTEKNLLNVKSYDIDEDCKEILNKIMKYKINAKLEDIIIAIKYNLNLNNINLENTFKIKNFNNLYLIISTLELIINNLLSLICKLKTTFNSKNKENSNDINLVYSFLKNLNDMSLCYSWIIKSYNTSLIDNDLFNVDLDEYFDNYPNFINILDSDAFVKININSMRLLDVKFSNVYHMAILGNVSARKGFELDNTNKNNNQKTNTHLYAPNIINASTNIECNDTLSILKSGLYMTYFFFNKESAIAENTKFSVKPNLDIARRIWNLLDVPSIKHLVELSLPKIYFRKEIYLYIGLYFEFNKTISNRTSVSSTYSYSSNDSAKGCSMNNVNLEHTIQEINSMINNLYINENNKSTIDINTLSLRQRFNCCKNCFYKGNKTYIINNNLLNHYIEQFQSGKFLSYDYSHVKDADGVDYYDSCALSSKEEKIMILETTTTNNKNEINNSTKKVFMDNYNFYNINNIEYNSTQNIIKNKNETNLSEDYNLNNNNNKDFVDNLNNNFNLNTKYNTKESNTIFNIKKTIKEKKKNDTHKDSSTGLNNINYYSNYHYPWEYILLNIQHQSNFYLKVKLLHSEYLNLKEKDTNFVVKGLKSAVNTINCCSSTINKYVPKNLIIHIHGGGFVAMSSSSHEMYLRKWINELNIPLISFDYKLSPNSKFPEALNEIYKGYIWLLVHSYEELGIDPYNIILAGDSAGGNLCLGLLNLLIINRVKLPTLVILSYPALRLDIDFFTPSYLNMLNDFILPYHIVKFCFDCYIDYKNLTYIGIDNPFLSPIYTPDSILKHYPSVRIVVGSKDPLRDDSLRFADKLLKLKKDVKLFEFEYFPHGFLNYDIPILFKGLEEVTNIITNEMKQFIK